MKYSVFHCFSNVLNVLTFSFPLAHSFFLGSFLTKFQPLTSIILITSSQVSRFLILLFILPAMITKIYKQIESNKSLQLCLVYFQIKSISSNSEFDQSSFQEIVSFQAISA